MTFINAVFNNLYIIKVQRCQIIKKIVMITTDIDNLRTEIFHHLHYHFEEIRMLRFPLA